MEDKKIREDWSEKNKRREEKQIKGKPGKQTVPRCDGLYTHKMHMVCTPPSGQDSRLIEDTKRTTRVVHFYDRNCALTSIYSLSIFDALIEAIIAILLLSQWNGNSNPTNRCISKIKICINNGEVIKCKNYYIPLFDITTYLNTRRKYLTLCSSWSLFKGFPEGLRLSAKIESAPW